MITWMQRHKKYLVVTIWISVIAFVGAGFVGWGAYDFNSDRASAVAKVGDRKITVQQFQLAYANHYNFYNNMMGGELTQEKADELGLDKIVINSLINEAILLSYADEIGLIALDDEVKAKISSDDSFKENGVFNKEIYYNAVKRMGLSANEYEKNLKKQVLLEKLQKALKVTATKSELELFKAAILMKDKLEVSSISVDPANIKVDDKDAKLYWEAHKNDYMSVKNYDVEYIDVPLISSEIAEDELKTFYEEQKHKYTDAEGKILSYENAKEQAKKDLLLKKTKKLALTTYLSYKKGETKADKKRNILDNDVSFDLEKLREAVEGEVLKPMEYKDGYIIARVLKINSSVPKSFEAAKAEVVATLFASTKEKELEKLAKSRLATFKGQSTDFVSRDSITKILNLDEATSADFVNYVFDNKAKEGYKIIGDKAILYRVLEQKLLLDDQDNKYDDLIKENVIQVKQTELNQNMIKKLTGRYESEQYYKGK